MNGIIKYFSALFIITALTSTLFLGCSKDSEVVSDVTEWQKSPIIDENTFPIAVWLQNPARASEYKAAGINVYAGLWKGPTESQLSALKSAGMKVICDQNAVGLKHIDDPVIIAWMHGDEPDNAQWNSTTKTYDPPILPSVIINNYNTIKSKDSSRPVLLNLGQGVANDEYKGRGTRTGHMEDYPEYVKGCDIAAFDIYPVASTREEVHGKLWLVAKGVERLVEWTEGKKTVWNCIESTRISNPSEKATPHKVRAEVWMSIIHGSTGIIYFVHEWEPKFVEAGLLADPEMLTAVTALNNQIQSLASVILSSTVAGELTVSSSNTAVPVASMEKKQNGAIYVFAVGMRSGETDATFTLSGITGEKSVEVLGESRTIASNNGVFTDTFEPWGAHLYKIIE